MRNSGKKDPHAVVGLGYISQAPLRCGWQAGKAGQHAAAKTSQQGSGNQSPTGAEAGISRR
jgi:hypothetical protein